jgi:hypothetical protein
MWFRKFKRGILDTSGVMCEAILKIEIKHSSKQKQNPIKTGKYYR